MSSDAGRTSYGSDDLNATLDENAITYSDGTNSGIVISNVSSASNTITFDVKFNEISNEGSWIDLNFNDCLDDSSMK